MHYQLIEAPLIRGERDSVMFLEGRHVPIVAPFVTKLYIRSHLFSPLSRADRSANTWHEKKRFLETHVDHLAQTYSQQSRPNSNLDMVYIRARGSENTQTVKRGEETKFCCLWSLRLTY